MIIDYLCVFSYSIFLLIDFTTFSLQKKLTAQSFILIKSTLSFIFLYLDLNEDNGLYDIGQEKGFGVKQSIWIGDTDSNIFDVKLQIAHVRQAATKDTYIMSMRHGVGVLFAQLLHKKVQMHKKQ